MEKMTSLKKILYLVKGPLELYGAFRRLADDSISKTKFNFLI